MSIKTSNVKNLDEKQMLGRIADMVIESMALSY